MRKNILIAGCQITNKYSNYTYVMIIVSALMNTRTFFMSRLLQMLGTMLDTHAHTHYKRAHMQMASLDMQPSRYHNFALRCGEAPSCRTCHSQYLRKRCIERFQLVATTPRERGSSTSESFATCNEPLKRDSGDSSHAHVCVCTNIYLCIDI